MCKFFHTMLALVAMTNLAFAEPLIPSEAEGNPIELTDSQMDTATAGLTGDLTLNIATVVNTNTVVAPATAIAVSGFGNANAGAMAVGFARNTVGLGQSVRGGGGFGLGRP